MNIALTILILSVIIVVHEFGHFIAAKRGGVLIEEFALGMGPTVLSKKWGETKFSIRLFPVGGFCKLYGEDGEADAQNGGDGEEPLDTEKTLKNRAFYNKSILRRVIILSAGSLMNFVLAFVFLAFITAATGTTLPIIEDVMPGYPAEAAGVQPGDQIVSLNNYRVFTYDDVSFALSDAAQLPTFEVVVRREGKTLTLAGETRLDEESGRRLFGIMPRIRAGFANRSPEYQTVNILETVHTAFFTMVFWLRSTFILLARIFAAGFTTSVFTGPVGLTAVVGTVYSEAATVSVLAVVVSLLNFCAFFSANVGMMNLLPLPALDGGRLMFIFIEAVTRRRVPPDKEAIVHFIGFALFIALAVVVAVGDFRTYYGG